MGMKNVGKYLLSFDDDGNVNKQGVIRQHWKGGYEVQLFSWLDGNPNGTCAMSEGFVKHYCKLYDDRNEWLREGDRLFNLAVGRPSGEAGEPERSGGEGSGARAKRARCRRS